MFFFFFVFFISRKYRFSVYAVSRLRKKTGYTKKQFYDQALKIYKEVHLIYLLETAHII